MTKLTLTYPAANEAAAPRLPPVLSTVSRDGEALVDPFLPPMQPGRSFVLAPPRRGLDSTRSDAVSEHQLLALEAADGSTVFIRSDRLQEALARLHPEAARADTLDLRLLRDAHAPSRGLGDWLWNQVSELSLGADDIIATATKAARDAARQWLGDRVEDAAAFGASELGARALMAAIESRLPQQPGLYQWRGGELRAEDRMEDGDGKQCDARMVAAAEKGPLLVFIHGTASHTLGSFDALRGKAACAEWRGVEDKFGDRVYGFEHRTFSQSPIENALQLARALPAGARLCVVTHSRGGLVGDLLCLGKLDRKLIRSYRRAPRPNERKAEKKAPWRATVREALAKEEQARLEELAGLLEKKQFRIERYLRVACPARGTTLLSDNLEVFLSGLLALVGLASGLSAHPVYRMLRRVVLEIADKRLDARIVPGIEAMLPDSPMGALLAMAPRNPHAEMAVIAGDIEGDAMWKRIGLMFTDWFFDAVDNDLVVDTLSMYGGLAQREGTRYLFDKGNDVSHFNYFANSRTRRALRDWLTIDTLSEVAEFSLLPLHCEPGREIVAARGALRGTRGEGASRPVVIYLPGVMGSHLSCGTAGNDADRVWFNLPRLIGGRLGDIARGKADVHADGIFEMFYGDLADYLEASHEVIRFAYDWRLSNIENAKTLAKVLRKTLADFPRQPVRILAHSMGGLVTRAMIELEPELWDDVVAREGGRLVMLGTPNNGSHLMVESLLGISSSMRSLARLDLSNDLQAVVDIVGGFTGPHQLLPRPGFADTAHTPFGNYFEPNVWVSCKERNNDRWFGDRIGALPDETVLEEARALWELLGGNTIRHPERVSYVFGKADNTPCGITEVKGQVRMLGTPEGDGSVTWRSGRLDNLPDERYWFMPVPHADLTDTQDYFPAVLELLNLGHTAQLERLPASRGGEAPVRSYEPGPPVFPTEDELARSLLGSRPRSPASRRRQRRLDVSVRAMDLRFAQQPVMCGHYPRDAISGAESQIDRFIVKGALSMRERLGIYAGELGSCALVLNPVTEEDRLRNSRGGALIVGLGEFGKLGVTDIVETVRAGVLRYLLHAQDHAQKTENGDAGVGLASVLIGYNSTANITIEDSVQAIVRGVCEANQQFGAAMRGAALVTHLEFVELFLDNAITAAQAVRELPQRLERESRRLDTRIMPAAEMRLGEGARPRLQVAGGFGYWPRMIVTQTTSVSGAVIGERFAQSLQYTFLTERARVETVVEHRQPGLIEKLVDTALAHTRQDASLSADLSRTLFQLLVPLDFKSAARAAERLVLVVDPTTANLPWELLQADDEPMVLRTALVRQLSTTSYRRGVRHTEQNNALVIGNPSTQGYYTHFGDPACPLPTPEDDHLPDLAGAADEALKIDTLLKAQGWHTEFVPPEADMLRVMTALFRRPYRVLAIAAHGVFQVSDRDGEKRGGVVLSDGSMLGAAEIGKLETVPELVFLNCCHLGRMHSKPDASRLAASIARELIDVGVRCVVAAGWPVDDAAANTFAETFFTAMASDNLPFGRAVWEARRAAWAKHRDCNTWGAYQAYGDPAFVLDAMAASGTARRDMPVSPLQLVDRLNQLRHDACRADARECRRIASEVERMLRSAPPEWTTRADVACAEAQVLGELGGEWFEAACLAYQRALAAPGTSMVPLSAVEDLANLEARTGLQQGRADLIERAIARLNALLLDTSHHTGIGAPNAERWALLGGAWKRMAMLLASKPRAKWGSTIENALLSARSAYAAGSGHAGAPDFSPYNAINRLQLDVILAEPGKRKPRAGSKPAQSTPDAALARHVAQTADGRFAVTLDFFDAILPIDALLTEYLLDGSLPKQEELLMVKYREAIDQVPTSSRKLDTVARQLQFIARCLQLKGRLAEAECLERIGAMIG